jgi:hypothetical protein
MFKLILALVSLAGFGYIALEFTKGYIAAGGYQVTAFHRFMLAAEGSATILWGRFVAAVSLIGLFLVNTADYFNLPGVAAIIPSYFTPQTVLLLMAAVSVVSEMARRRTLNV